MSAMEILVVEDEPLIRLTLAEFLNDAGYGVMEAADADQALALLESCPDIALLLVDLNLPGRVDGASLAEEAARIWPEIPVLFTSGLAESDARARIGERPFLPKPYRAVDIRHAVGDLLKTRDAIPA